MADERTLVERLRGTCNPVAHQCADRIEHLEARVAELEAMLPRTVGGVVPVKGERVAIESCGRTGVVTFAGYVARRNEIEGAGEYGDGSSCSFPMSHCYSTREAAEKARGA